MATLGALVEVVHPEGLSFSDHVQRHIMDPLGMSSSQFPSVQDEKHVKPEIFERFSTGYARFGRVYLPTPTVHFADYAGRDGREYARRSHPIASRVPREG